MGFRITTWNVNGIRNPFGYQPWRDRRTFEGMFDALEADIVIMQELKIQRKDLRDDMVLVPGWDCYFSLPKHKKGYSGVGIYTRQSVCAPVRAEEGVLGVLAPPGSTMAYRDLPADQHIGGYLSTEQLLEVNVDPPELDAEGRCVVLEFPAFVLFGIYSPANSSGTRDDFRHGFLNALDKRIRNLVAQGKRVVVTGDLNISRQEIDTANAEETMRKEGITHEDYLSTPNRRIFNQLLEGGIVYGERDEGREGPVMWDICRGFHPTRKGMFTHWEQKINARPGNYGSRIDFVLCSLDMKPWFCESNIQEGLMGSDHCPVYAVIQDEIEIDGAKVNIKDIMNPAGYFSDGQRQREYSVREVPVFSAKLLGEFDKRRSIKDMFGRKPSLKTTESFEASLSTIKAPSEPADHYSSPKTTSTLPSNGVTTQDIPAVEQSSPSRPTSIPAVPAPLDRKRTATGPPSGRTLKRSKSITIPAPVNNLSKSQSSLKGFFKPKMPAQASMDDQSSPARSQPDVPSQLGNPESMVPPVEMPNETVDQISIAGSAPLPSTQGSTVESLIDQPSSPEEIIDPIVSKESWSRLFTKPAAPRCEHNEPCKTMQTKKKGFNCGREFWMCARPLGPSGAKERNTQWRCSTFIWSSDWNGTGENNH